MRRRTGPRAATLSLAGLAAALAVAAPPVALAAAPAALTRDTGEGLAVAGGGVLVGRVGGDEVHVDRYPARGGPPARIFTSRSPTWSGAGNIRIAASRSTAAAVVTSLIPHGPPGAQAFAGPATGPLSELGAAEMPAAGRFLPYLVTVDGRRVVKEEWRSDPPGHRFVVLDPGREPATTPLPDQLRLFTADLAGDRVAYGEPTRAERRRGDHPRRLVVADWRTGSPRWRRSIRGRVETLDLHADGRVLIGEHGGGVLEVAPGGVGVRRISSRGSLPAYAGSRVVFVRPDARGAEARLFVAGADRRPHAFGVPSAEIDRFAVDERLVAWQAHGCVLAAPVGSRAALAPAAGACARSELQVLDRRVRLRRNRRIGIVLRCIAAPRGGCRGSLRLEVAPAVNYETIRASRRRRFRIPVRGRRRIVLRVTRRAAGALRRDASVVGRSFVEVGAALVDPDGRRSRLASSVAVSLP